MCYIHTWVYGGYPRYIIRYNTLLWWSRETLAKKVEKITVCTNRLITLRSVFDIWKSVCSSYWDMSCPIQPGNIEGWGKTWNPSLWVWWLGMFGLERSPQPLSLRKIFASRGFFVHWYSPVLMSILLASHTTSGIITVMGNGYHTSQPASPLDQPHRQPLSLSLQCPTQYVRIQPLRPRAVPVP